MRTLFLFILAAAVARAVTTPTAEPFTPKERAQRFSDRVILAKPKVENRSTVDAAETRERVRIRNKFSRLGDVRVIEVDASETVAQAIERLQATGRYEYVEPDYIETPDATPNDTNFPLQWALNNTGQLTGSTPGADIKAVPAWDIIREAPEVIVAIIDNGINITHRDIAPNLWRNPAPTFGDINGAAFVRGVRSGNVADQTGHGTHVAGIIGAVGNNTFNISGIAWKVQLMALKNSDATGVSSASDSAACLDYAVSKGAHIVNCSFGGSGFSQTFVAALRAAREAGVIVVASAGNDAANVDESAHFPANYLLDNIVSVGSSGPTDLPSGSSAFGGLVDLFAPGISILSLDLTTTGQTSRSGTSMAAPHVTGALALLKARFPGDSYRQLINRLLQGVDRSPAFMGRAHSGGRLNLLGALNASSQRPFNDDFASRALIVGSGITFRSNNTGATFEPGEPLHAGAVTGGTLWWQWTAPTTGPVTLSTIGSTYDTVIAVYSGSALNALTPVASNDDANGQTTSQVSFVAQLGVTYYIAVSGKGGGTGPTIVNFGAAPPNDVFANATPLPPVQSTHITGTTWHATHEAGEPNILNSAGGGSVWYRWVAPRSGRFQVAAFTGDFDLLLAVYTGGAVNQLTLLAASDDTGVEGINSNSVCTFQATSGVTYYFKVDCKDPLTRGEFTLNLTDSLWQFSTDGAVSGTAAVASDGTIYVGGGSPDPNFYAIAPDGSSKWVYRAGGTMNYAAPAVGLDGTIYFGATDGRVTALRPDGTVLWQRNLNAGSLSVSPAIGIDGTVYIHGTDTFLYALHPHTGATRWRAFVDADAYAAASIGPDGTIYHPSDSGFLYALRPDGSTKWRFTTGSITFSSPAIDAMGNIYFTTYTGATLFCLSPSGTLRWSFSDGAAAALAGSPVLSADGTAVHVGSASEYVYAVNTVDGSLRWRARLEDRILGSSPAVDSNGTVYVGCVDNRVYAINANGTIKRTWDTARPVQSSPTIAGNRLYIGSGDAKLYAFEIDGTAAAGTWTQYRQGPTKRGRYSGGVFALTLQPQPVNRVTSQSFILSVAATGPEPMTFQWFKDGVPIPGATLATYIVSTSTASDAASYTVTVTSPQGTLTSSAAAVRLEPLIAPRIANFSVRAVPGAGAQTLLVGFTISEGSPKPVLLRGVGPSLTAFGVVGAMVDPQLALFSGNTVMAVNDNWAGDAGVTAAMSRVSAFPLDAASRDAAITRTLPPGRYGAEMVGINNTTGVSLLELYDADPVSTNAVGLSRLTNVSARAQIGTANNIFTAGFTIVGNLPRTLLIRVVGPALTSLGVTGAASDPILEIYNGTTLVGRNDDWGGTAAMSSVFAQAGAFPLPLTSFDSALVVSLPAGVYNARVIAAGLAGVGLLELYELP